MIIDAIVLYALERADGFARNHLGDYVFHFFILELIMFP